MQRKWTVPPDQGQVLSREALIAALVDGAVMLDIAGGCLEVVVGRAPTGVPGEMVMTGAVLCWKDRTDGKPQAEVAASVVPESESPELPDRPRIEPASAEEIMAEAEARELADDAPLPDHIDPDDGFDYSTLAEEDVDDAPVGAR